MRKFASFSFSDHVRGLLVAWLAVVGMVGCSQDIHVFESTPSQPVTIALVDPLTDTTMWEMDVPVDHKLKLDLNRRVELGPFYADMRPATKLTWRVYPLKGFSAVEKDQLQLPGREVMIRVSYRPGPEYPPDAEIAAMDVVEEATVEMAEPQPVEAITPGPATGEPVEAEDGGATSMPEPEEAGEVMETDASVEEADIAPDASANPAPEAVEATEESADEAVEETVPADEISEDSAGDEETIPLPGLE